MITEKVAVFVHPGDMIRVSSSKEDKLSEGNLCLISHNEKQWIEIYKPELEKFFNNVYPIVQVVWYS